MPKNSSSREQTPSFVVDIPLRVSQQQEKVLLSRLEAGRQLYNACLGEAMRRLNLVKQSRDYQKALSLKRKDPKRNKLFKQARERYNFSDYGIQGYATRVQHSWIGDHIDSNTAQKLGTRAYNAAQKVMLGQAKKVRFKGKNQMDSLEGKSNKSGIRWKDQLVQWSGLTLLPYIENYDPVQIHGLNHRVKYVRIVRRKRGGKNFFYAQLVCEGKPFQKLKNTIGSGTVGIDIGPSTIAIVGDDSAHLEQFASELQFNEKQIRRLQRKLDRQRRANNPNNYRENGTIKPGKKRWNDSKGYKKTQNRIAELQRRTAAHRKSLHGRLAHDILRLGNKIQLEKLSYKAFQKLFGKSVGKRAPGMFVAHLKRLAESAGAIVVEFPTYTTKLSQTCHCGQVNKKRLSIRVHRCDCGVEAQRDLYSAFLSRFVNPQTNLLQADLANLAWSGSEQILRAAWRQATINQPASGGRSPASFGRLQSQSGSPRKKSQPLLRARML